MNKRTRPTKPAPQPAKRSALPPGLHPVMVPAAILFAALLLRVLGLWDIMGSLYNGEFLLWDERIYHRWAVKIADGTFTSRLVYEFPPLFAYLMAGVYRLFSHDTVFIRVLNVLFGVLACGFIALIGRELGGRRTAVIAMLIACLCKPLIFYSVVPLKESLSACLFSATVWLTLAVLKERSLAKAGLLGLAAGLLLNVRPNAGILVPLIPLVLAWHGYREKTPWRRMAATVLLAVAGFTVAVGPFLVRNYRVAGEWALTTSQGGFNLYFVNTITNPDPYYRPATFATSSPFEQGIQFTIEASRRAGRTLTSEEASAYWTREVLREALAHPAPFLENIGRKALALVNGFDAADHYDIPFVSRFVPFFRIPFPGFLAIFPLAMAGFASALRHREVRVLGLLLGAYAATLVVFFTTARYRLPMYAILVPFAALGFDAFRPLFRRQFSRTAIAPAAAFALSLALALLPVRGTDDTAAYYNTHAIILDSRGSTDEAISYWRASSDMGKRLSAYADLALAGKYSQQGMITEAEAFLDRIPDTSFAAALKYAVWGDILLRERKQDLAMKAYRRALEINSGLRAPRRKLIKLYRAAGDERRAAEEEKNLKYIQSFYDLM